MFVRGIQRLGMLSWEQWRALRHAAAVIGTVLCFAFQPRSWHRTCRSHLARQVLEIAIEPLLFVCAVAAFVGMSVVVQLAFWTGRVGQSQLLGPLLVAVVARELGPILVNLIIITRSSSAMAMELASLKLNGVIATMDSQGRDPFTELVFPRVLAFALSTFCLTLCFVLVALTSGYLFGAWLGTGSRNFGYFTGSVLAALHPQDMINISAKSILPALFSGATCCIAGLDVSNPGSDLTRVTERALTRSVAGLFVISTIISVLAYL
jgi:phospholipid/cholesterol/gamma-HCH transport system permease protein